MNTKKIKLGQFFTKKDLWLKPQIHKFIESSNKSIAYDPFAGGGHLLTAAENIGFKLTKGLDIDTNLSWDINDSLISIPLVEDSIIITNPPYIAKQSAKRKKIDLSKYFDSTVYDDVYLLSLDKMLEHHKYVVAIIPESFINSNYKKKNLLYSITILEENPFDDTENPVCVVCFDGKPKSYDKIKVYKGEKYLNNLEYFNNLRISPNKSIKISFNDKNGWLGLRATDSSNGINRISFFEKDAIKYDWDKNIKVSSRHITLIDIQLPKSKQKELINNANKIIDKLRESTSDVIFTPFKGNDKFNKRRRRLDFKLARAILEIAYNQTIGEDNYEQFRLF